MFVRLRNILLVVINILSAVLTILSAYGGMFNPDRFYALPAMLAMAFPLVLLLMLAVFLCDLFFNKKMLWLQLFVLVFISPEITNFWPLGLGASEPIDQKEKSTVFSVLTYNAFGMNPFRDGYKYEDTFKAIYESDADVICFQEANCDIELQRQRFGGNETIMAIVDSLEKRYPYRICTAPSYAVYSKYKVKEIPTPELPGSTGTILHYEIEIAGKNISFYNVHLESIGLDSKDKELYRHLTDGKAKKGDVPKVKSQILSKLRSAFQTRASQARAIRSIIDLDRADTQILCGDFNDITGCYAMRTIMGDDLNDAYTESAFFPGITYRDNRFYFFIDHILYGKGLKVINSNVIYGGASDHYPLKAEFYF